MLTKISQLLFFDNVALYYLSKNVPKQILAKSFSFLDPRLVAAFLNVMNKKDISQIYKLMQQEAQKPKVNTRNQSNENKEKKISEALLLLANDLCDQGFVYKKMQYFYGVALKQENTKEHEKIS